MSRDQRGYCALVVSAAFVLATPAQAQQSVAGWANVDSVPDQRRLQPSVAPTLGPVPQGLETLALAPGDLLQMSVYGVPEMSLQLRINERGQVTIPFAGPVDIAGQSMTRAQDSIARVLIDDEILKHPQVTLNLLQFRARDISVLGEVQMPGRIQLLTPQPLGDVLALAGGETIAAGNDIEIEHRRQSGQETAAIHIHVARDEASALRETLVEPGDTVVVHRAGVIFVLGAVNRPGGYLMANGGSLNVVEAVSLAGGETVQASSRQAIIVRRRNGAVEQIKVPLREMETGKIPAADLELDDALYIPSSGWKSVVMNGSNVLSAAAAASIYAASNRP